MLTPGPLDLSLMFSDYNITTLTKEKGTIDFQQSPMDIPEKGFGFLTV